MLETISWDTQLLLINHLEQGFRRNFISRFTTIFGFSLCSILILLIIHYKEILGIHLIVLF